MSIGWQNCRKRSRTVHVLGRRAVLKRWRQWGMNWGICFTANNGQIWGLGCFHKPWVGPWSWCSCRGLCWCLWLPLPPSFLWMLRVWVTTLWASWCSRNVLQQRTCQSRIPVSKLRTMMTLCQDCCQETCPCCDWALSWCPRLLLPPMSMQSFLVCANTWDHVALRDSNCHGGSIDLGGPF